MGNAGLSTLLDISKRSLGVQSQALRVIGNNIANVNTAGYARRRTEIIESDTLDLDGGAFGTGVEIRAITRYVDNFLNESELERISGRGRADVMAELLSRAEAPFSLDRTNGRIGTELAAFFSALQDLAANPASIGLRSSVIARGQALTNAINNSYSTLADLQHQADSRIDQQVGEVNRLTSEIAELNGRIASTELSDQDNNTLRDKRDELLRELSERLTIRTIENSDGSVSVALETGFSLVSGINARTLDFTTQPSFAPSGSGFPPGLDGNKLGFIVYDFDPSTTDSHVNLTNTIAGGGGELAGLLRVRGLQSDTDTTAFDAVGDLPELASRVEAIARDLLIRFNTSYLGPTDENPGGNFDASSGDLQGNRPSVFGLFTFDGATDAVVNGLPQVNDLTAIGNPNYAGSISFAISDPTNIAAAVDLNSTGLAYSFAPGDGTNIENLVALREAQVDYSTYGVGSLATTTTVEDLYHDTVGRAGSLAGAAAHESEIATDLETQIKELIASTSGVSLDEEFAQLITFQRAFQASSRMIRLGDDLLDEVINLLR